MTAISPYAYGAVGNGIADDTSAVQQALNAAAPNGGSVTLEDGKFLVAGVNVPKGVALIADNSWAGVFADGVAPSSPNQNTAQTVNRGGQIILGVGGTIQMQSGSKLEGLLIVRQNLGTLPLNQTGINNFAGTAVTVRGDDVMVEGCLIWGFNRGLHSNGHQRVRMTDVGIDCTNGVEISNCLDVPYLTRVHCWPYTTVNGFGGAPLIRTGTAFYLNDRVDNAHLTDCFSFGFFRGLEVRNANAVQAVNCAFDQFVSGGASGHAGSIGVRVLGTSVAFRMVGGAIVGQGQAGVELNMSDASADAALVGVEFFYATPHGVLLNGVGLASVTGCNFKDIGNGITVNNGNARVVGVGNTFVNIGASWNLAVQTDVTKCVIGDNVYVNSGGVSPNGNLLVGTVAPSGGNLYIPPSGDYFYVASGTTINQITGLWAGRKVCLLFSGGQTLVNNGFAGNPIHLQGGANWSPAGGHLIEVIGQGNGVNEIVRRT